MKTSFIAVAAILSIPLGACGQRQDASVSQDLARNNGSVPKKTSAEMLLAAAEPFEKLTETAFDAALPAIDTTVTEANRAADTVRGLLSPAGAKNMDGLLADIARYRQQGDRADIALASIEIYRLIVSSVPAGTKIPSEVSLLDYAGFRYQADLKATPTRWSDMAEAVSFARTQWSVVQARLSPGLVTDFETALTDMEKAIKTQNPALAQTSATAELDLVDKLEGYFSSSNSAR